MNSIQRFFLNETPSNLTEILKNSHLNKNLFATRPYYHTIQLIEKPQKNQTRGVFTYTIYGHRIS